LVGERTALINQLGAILLERGVRKLEQHLAAITTLRSGPRMRRLIVAPLALRTILDLNQSYKSFTLRQRGRLWGCGQREALSIKSTACPIR
jgi:hypothetical protein